MAPRTTSSAISQPHPHGRGKANKGLSNEFLNPKSMLTPGIAGGMVMVITNSLYCAFGLPQAYVALGCSLIFGLLVLGADRIPHWQRFIYYLLNSLIIFSVSAGANFSAIKLTQESAFHKSSAFVNLIAPPYVNSVYAQNTPQKPQNKQNDEHLTKPRTGHDASREYSPRFGNPGRQSPPPSKSRRFFSPW